MYLGSSAALLSCTPRYPSTTGVGYICANRMLTFARLLLQNLTEGGKVWGAVLDVAAKRLTVSLPHGLRGIVNAEDASDVLAALMAPVPSKADRQLRAAIIGPPPSLSDIFYPGQIVQCSVKSLEASNESADGVAKDTVRSLCLLSACSSGHTLLHISTYIMMDQ